MTKEDGKKSSLLQDVKEFGKKKTLTDEDKKKLGGSMVKSI